MRFGLTPRLMLLMLGVMVVPLLITSRLILEEVDRSTVLEIEGRLERSLVAARQALEEARDRLSVRVKDFSGDPVFLALLRDAGPEALAAHLREFLRREELAWVELRTATGAPILVTQAPPRQGQEFPPELASRAEKMELAAQLSLEELLHLDVAVGVRVYGQTPSILLVRKVVPYNFLDPLRDLAGVELTLAVGGRRVITSLMDADSRRLVNAEIPKVPELAEVGFGATFNRPMFAETFIGREYLTLSRSLPNGSGRTMLLLASIPREMLGNLRAILDHNLRRLLLVCALLAGVLGLVLASHLIRPVQMLTTIAGGLMTALQGSRGEDVPAAIQSTLAEHAAAMGGATARSDELGILSRSFAMMSERLSRKLFELHTLFRVSGGMNFMNNRDQLLNYILDQTLVALEAERGSIMLFNAELSALRVELVKARGIDLPVELDEEGNPKRRLIAPGTGIAGRVFSEGKSIIANQGFADQRFSRAGDAEPDQTKVVETTIRNLLCVPLKVNEQVIGVLNVTNRLGEQGFDDDDRTLLEALGSLAAVTIENAKLYELSITDGLTRLFIHRYFQIRLEEEIIRSRRYNATLSLILFDVDHFKKFNDTYGHQTGDQVLRKVAKVLNDTVRRNVDIPCRYGGEEFAVIAPETGGEDGFNLAERIRKRIEATTVVGPAGEVLRVTISLGVATCPLHTEERAEIIRMADESLYQSKRRGRNTATLWPGPG